MEQMIIEVSLGLLFVFLIILTMDISHARHRIKKLDDIVYGLQTRLWGDWEQDPSDSGEYGKHIAEISRLERRIDASVKSQENLERLILAAAPKPKAKKAQKTVAAKKR